MDSYLPFPADCPCCEAHGGQTQLKSSNAFVMRCKDGHFFQLIHRTDRPGIVFRPEPMEDINGFSGNNVPELGLADADNATCPVCSEHGWFIWHLVICCGNGHYFRYLDWLHNEDGEPFLLENLKCTEECPDKTYRARYKYSQLPKY